MCKIESEQVIEYLGEFVWFELDSIQCCLDGICDSFPKANWRMRENCTSSGLQSA